MPANCMLRLLRCVLPLPCSSYTSHTACTGTPHTSRLTPHTSHLAPHASHLTPRTSHLAPHASHLTPDKSRLTRHTKECKMLFKMVVRANELNCALASLLHLVYPTTLAMLSTSAQGLTLIPISAQLELTSPFRSTCAYFVPHINQNNRWKCPNGAQVEL